MHTRLAIPALAALAALWALSAPAQELFRFSFEPEEETALRPFPAFYAGEKSLFAPVADLNGHAASEGRHFLGLNNLQKDGEGKVFWHSLTLPPVSLEGATNACLQFDFFSDGFDKEDYFQYALLLESTNILGPLQTLPRDTSGRWLTVTLPLPPALDWAGLLFKIKQSGGADYAGLDFLRLTAEEAVPRRQAAPLLALASNSWAGLALDLSSAEPETLLARGAGPGSLLTNRPPDRTGLEPGARLGEALVLASAPGRNWDCDVVPGRTYCYRAWQIGPEGLCSQGSRLQEVAVPELPAPALAQPDFHRGTLEEDRARFPRPEEDPRLEILLEVATAPEFLPAPLPFFSEYGKGSGDNRFLEIYNPLPETLQLDRLKVCIFPNGSELAGQTILPEGELPSRETFVIANNKAGQEILAQAGLATPKLDMTGNDAVLLFLDDEAVDAIGVIGECPKTAWAVAGVSPGTANHTLVRLPETGRGTLDWRLGQNQWEVRPKDDIGDLGCHACTAPERGTLLEPWTGVPLPEEGLAVTGLLSSVSYYARARAAYNGHLGPYGPLCGPFQPVPEPHSISHIIAGLALLASLLRHMKS